MEDIKKIVHSDAAYEILDNSNAPGSTWTSGGCAILARAINMLEGHPMYIIFNRNYKTPEHFGVKLPTGKIFDADGEHNSEEEWLNFFKDNEIVRQGELIVIPYVEGMNIGDIMFDDNASKNLVELIKSKSFIRETIRNVLRESVLNEKMVLKDYNLYIELVSNAYQQANSYDSSAIKHWEALNKSNYSLFKRLLSKVNVVFTTNDKSKVGKININNKSFSIEYITPEQEYKTQSEMKKSFNDTGVLKISIDFSNHPYFSVADNIVFRTVHDYIAHILGDYNFGAKGEIACYNLHKKMAPKDAVPALFTEVVGQVSTTIVTGSFPEQKIVVLDGFDFYNIGKVDDENYEIIDKVLVKKGEDFVNFKKDSESDFNEPLAIHSQLKEKFSL